MHDPHLLHASCIRAGRASDGRTFKPVMAVQHIQITSGVELHVTVTYEVVP